MADPLAALWERVDLPSPLLDGDEVLRWEDGALDHLLAAGVVRETDTALSAVCDACDFAHVEDVMFIDSPRGTGVRAYIMCPDNGRVRVPIERLRQWEVDFDGLARALATAFDRDAVPAEIAPSRVWFIGKAVFAARSRDVFLARGLFWADAAAVVAAASRLATSGAPLVLVAGAVPPAAVWGTVVPPVLPLSAVLSLRDDRVVLDKMHVEGALSGDGGPARILTSEERKRRIKDRQAIFPDVKLEFATEPGVRHIVRINGFDFGGFRKSDLKFSRLLLLAVTRAADHDAQGGGWFEKHRWHGDERDRDLYEVREELEKYECPDLTREERRALIKSSGRRDGQIRLAVHPLQVAFDDSLADFQFVGEEQTKPKKGARRQTSGTAAHEEHMRGARMTAKKLLAQARRLGVPSERTSEGRGE